MGSSSTLRVLAHCFSYDRAWMYKIPYSITKRLRPLGAYRLSTHLPQSVPEYGGIIDIRLTISETNPHSVEDYAQDTAICLFRMEFENGDAFSELVTFIVRLVIGPTYH